MIINRSFPIKFNPNSKSNPTITTTIIIIIIMTLNPVSSWSNICYCRNRRCKLSLTESQKSFIVFQQSNRFGHLNIDIQNNGTNLVGKFISNEGEVLLLLDQFTINKSGASFHNLSTYTTFGKSVIVY